MEREVEGLPDHTKLSDQNMSTVSHETSQLLFENSET